MWETVITGAKDPKETWWLKWCGILGDIMEYKDDIWKKTKCIWIKYGL